MVYRWFNLDRDPSLNVYPNVHKLSTRARQVAERFWLARRSKSAHIGSEQSATEKQTCPSPKNIILSRLSKVNLSRHDYYN